VDNGTVGSPILLARVGHKDVDKDACNVKGSNRKATGFSVEQLPESSAITPAGRDTYKTAQGYG